MLSVSSSFISTYWPAWIFVTSLAGNGGKVDESFTPDATTPALSVGVAELDISDVGQSMGALASPAPLPPAGGSELREAGGIIATDAMAAAGGNTPRGAGGGGDGNGYNTLSAIRPPAHRPSLAPGR